MKVRMPRLYCTPAGRCRCRDSRKIGHLAGHMQRGLVPSQNTPLQRNAGSQHLSLFHRFATVFLQLPLCRARCRFADGSDLPLFANSDRLDIWCRHIIWRQHPDSQQATERVRTSLHQTSGWAANGRAACC